MMSWPLEWGNLRIDPSTCIASYGERPLPLSPKEYALLELLLRNRNQLHSLSTILDHLWSLEDPPGEETVRAHIKGLRRKLKAAGAPSDLLETVYGQGYRLNPIHLDHAQVEDHGTRQASEDDGQQTKAAMHQIWQRTKVTSLKRLATIEQAAHALHQQRLSDGLRQQARQEAHKLAGSLGTFGVMVGSQIARQMELLLQNAELGTKQGKQLYKLVKDLYQTVQEATDSPSLQPRPGLTIQTLPTYLVDQMLLLVLSPESSQITPLKTEADSLEFSHRSRA